MRNPISSARTITPSSAAFSWELGPAFASPSGDGGLVAFSGAAHRLLPGEADLAHQLADAVVVVADAEEAFDEVADHGGGPEVPVEAVLGWRATQGGDELATPIVVEQRGAAGVELADQPVASSVLPNATPATDGLIVDLKVEDDLLRRHAALEEVGGDHAHAFEFTGGTGRPHSRGCSTPQGRAQRCALLQTRSQ
jgi:hypothetical protein